MLDNFFHVKLCWLIFHIPEWCSLSRYSDLSFQILWLAAKSIVFEMKIWSEFSRGQNMCRENTCCNCSPLIWYPSQGQWLFPREGSISHGVALYFTSFTEEMRLSANSWSATMQEMTIWHIRPCYFVTPSCHAFS